MVERSLPIPEVHSSNPIIGKNLYRREKKRKKLLNRSTIPLSDARAREYLYRRATHTRENSLI